MAEILERTLDPRVAPRRVLFRHPHHELSDLGEYAATSYPLGVGPFPGNALPVPSEQRVGRDDRGDFAQGLTAQTVGSRGESPPIIIGEAQTPATQTAAAGGDSLRSDRPMPPVPGDPAKQ